MGGGSGWTAFSAVALSGDERGQRETLWDYIERSSDREAAGIRARWDRWLAQIPAAPRAKLIGRLKGGLDAQVRDALTELVTFALLDAVYPTVEIDPLASSGSVPDFAVNVPVRTYFEVNRKSEPAALSADARRRAVLAEELDKIESPDFWLSINAMSGAQIPSMQRVRREAEAWLVGLDYNAQVQRNADERASRAARLSQPMPGLDSSPMERAKYIAAHRDSPPPVFTTSGDGWRVEITAYPRDPAKRGPSQSTVWGRIMGEAHIATAADVKAAVDRKLRQHRGHTEPLVVVLDLTDPVIDDPDLESAMYGPLLIGGARNRKAGVWSEPLRQPPRPAAVITLSGVGIIPQAPAASLWLPPSTESPVLPGPWAVRALGGDQRSVISSPAAKPVADYLTPPPETGRQFHWRVRLVWRKLVSVGEKIVTWCYSAGRGRGGRIRGDG